MAIDHACLAVPKDKFNECLAMYLKALGPLGYEQRLKFGDGVVGLGSLNDPAIASYERADFWVFAKEDSPSTVHMAFSAKDRAAVDAFHAAAIAAGATCNGAPGLRSHYHPNYYGAFVLDAAGNNIEAVCHKPQ